MKPNLKTNHYYPAWRWGWFVDIAEAEASAQSKFKRSFRADDLKPDRFEPQWFALTESIAIILDRRHNDGKWQGWIVDIRTPYAELHYAKVAGRRIPSPVGSAAFRAAFQFHGDIAPPVSETRNG
jgi:hypothetical protein